MNMMKYELMQLAHMDFMNLIFAYVVNVRHLGYTLYIS